MSKPQVIAPPDAGAVVASPITVFVCANSARGGLAPTARFGRPGIPDFPWPGAVNKIVVPCTGRLQPEHLLKAFEAGADLVAVVACDEGNCHFVEGSCRAGRRCQYVGDLLDQIGVGRERLMVFHLPGSAREDMAAGVAKINGHPVLADAATAEQINAIAAQVARRLSGLAPTPLRENPAALEDLADSQTLEENED